MPAQPRIAIVGAGIAGLNAALTLRDAGLACDVYEASYRIGGRMHSDATTWTDGLVSEWCGEFIDGDHATMHQLIARFGLHTVPAGREGEGRAPIGFYVSHHFYDVGELAKDLQVLAPLLEQQAHAAGFPTTYARSTPEGLRLDHLSAYQWIEQYVADGHETPVGSFLDAACTGFYGLDTTEQSALNLVYMFSSQGRPRSPAAPRPLQGTSKIAGGNEQLPLAVARALPDGSIHLGHQLTAIERESDDSLTLTFATAGSASSGVRCDRAILALPFSTLRRVEYQHAGFDSLKRTAIQQLGYGTISKLFLEFDQPYWYGDGPWPQPQSGFLITDLELQTLWDASMGHAGTRSLLVDYTSGHRGAAFAPPAAYTSTGDASAAVGSATTARYAQNCLRQLEHVFPGISAHYTGRAALSYSTGDPDLLGSYACWRVGQYTRFAGYEGVRQGPIHFAGEHCSVAFQGFMEGAASEGARAAREILQDVR